MKIQISDDEVYELKLPEKVNNPEEFYTISKKLDNIAKIIKINMMTGTTFNKFKSEFQKRETKIEKGKYKTIFKRKLNPFFDTREKVLDIMQYFYHGTKADRERIVKIMGKTEQQIIKLFYGQKIRYDIQPQEIGFISFGTIVNKAGLKIPNYIIKSHTGVFDEKENGTNNTN